MFKEIEKKYSGWLETEEKTPLRNQLQWTRLRVEDPPDFMRSLIEVELEDLQDSYMGRKNSNSLQENGWKEIPAIAVPPTM